jgi:hypothetical protein
MSLWEHLPEPDVLIYSNASFDVGTKHKNFNCLPYEFAEQNLRLEHARTSTSKLTNLHTRRSWSIYWLIFSCESSSCKGIIALLRQPSVYGNRERLVFIGTRRLNILC